MNEIHALANSMQVADLNQLSNNENKCLPVGNKKESGERIQMEMEMEMELDFRMSNVFIGQLL